jgi:predicted phage tail protein
MLIKILGEREAQFPEFEFKARDLKSCLSALIFRYGESLRSVLNEEKFSYILGKKESENLLPLKTEVIGTDFGSYDILFIVPELSGEFPVPFIIAAALASAIGTSIATAASIIAVVTNVAIAIGISAIMTVLSPTNEMKNDPAQTLSSNLFGEVPLTQTQGGIVPVVLGEPICGGVLISSGLGTYSYNFPGLIYS